MTPKKAQQDLQKSGLPESQWLNLALRMLCNYVNRQAWQDFLAQQKPPDKENPHA